jgi:hypothetical protein
MLLFHTLKSIRFTSESENYDKNVNANLIVSGTDFRLIFALGV